MLNSLELKVLKNLKLANLDQPSLGLLILHSGGPDSQCLVQALENVFQSPLWKGKFPSLALIHFHHGLRLSADQDHDFVESLARKKKIPFVSIFYHHGKEIQQTNFQNRAHFWRKKTGVQIQQQFELIHDQKWFLLTAHHQDDHLETVLLNFIRGTGLEGLKGIPLISSCGQWIRPLIESKKEDVLSYCKEKKLSFRLDESNAKTCYRRNWIRHEIVPKLKTMNPSLSQTVFRMSEHVQESLNQMKKTHSDYVFSRNWLYNLIRKDFPELYKITKRSHIDNAMAHIHSCSRKSKRQDPKRSLQFSFAKNWDCLLTENNVTFFKRMKHQLRS
jgi:tRNA(Ile)-lysidine synthase